MRAILFALMLTVMSGCASSGRQIQTDSVQQLQIGVTTKDQMLGTFGAPMGQGYTGAGELSLTWVYVHVGPIGIGSQTQSLIAQFDKDGILQRFNLVDTGPGGGVRLGK